MILENPELDVNALRHAVIHRLNGSWDGVKGDGTEGDEGLEASERAEGNRDPFGVSRHAARGYRAKEVLRVPGCQLSFQEKRQSVAQR